MEGRRHKVFRPVSPTSAMGGGPHAAFGRRQGDGEDAKESTAGERSDAPGHEVSGPSLCSEPANRRSNLPTSEAAECEGGQSTGTGRGGPRVVLTLRCTPLGLAIAAAMAATSLALAFSLGRRLPLSPATVAEPPAVKTLNEIRLRQAVLYEDLQADRGNWQEGRGSTKENDQ